MDEKFDEIIQQALNDARELSLNEDQSREDYEASLRAWIDEIKTEIAAR